MGLANNSRLKEAIKQAIDKWGIGAVILFSSGFAANAGAISAIVYKGDVIISDELNHASKLIDAS